MSLTNTGITLFINGVSLVGVVPCIDEAKLTTGNLESHDVRT